MPVGSISPFCPAGTTSIPATGSSANTALVRGGDTVVVTNASGYMVYIRFGADSAVLASTSDMPILPNSRAILSVNSLINYVAAIAPSGSGLVLFSRGDGSVI